MADREYQVRTATDLYPVVESWLKEAHGGSLGKLHHSEPEMARILVDFCLKPTYRIGRDELKADPFAFLSRKIPSVIIRLKTLQGMSHSAKSYAEYAEKHKQSDESLSRDYERWATEAKSEHDSIMRVFRKTPLCVAFED